METIQKIEEVNVGGDRSWNSYGGFEITTDEQIIKLLIDNSQSCCEHWGYFFCHDDPQEFIGSAVLSVYLTDTALNTLYLEKNDVSPTQLDGGAIMFVNIETTKGLLQFVAYNEHNGYYGHKAIVECKQLNHEEVI